MHDRTTHGTLFHHLSGIHDFVQQVARYGSIISYCSVHLDTRKNHARNVIQPFRVFTISCNELHATGSVIPYCSVHLDARPIALMSVFYSCNKLHATGALFHIVACILMHDRITHGTLFNPFRVFTISCNKLHATGNSLVFTILKRCMLIIVSYDELC